MPLDIPDLDDLEDLDDDFDEEIEEKKKKKSKSKKKKNPKKILSPSELETFLRQKHGITHLISETDMKTLLQNSPEIPHDEAYFLLRIFRERKSLQNYYELIK